VITDILIIATLCDMCTINTCYLLTYILPKSNSFCTTRALPFLSSLPLPAHPSPSSFWRIFPPLSCHPTSYTPPIRCWFLNRHLRTYIPAAIKRTDLSSLSCRPSSAAENVSVLGFLPYNSSSSPTLSGSRIEFIT